jgi:ParB family chromosome partitioning protein
LPDFEKYAGFRLQREKTGQSQKEMAESAGVAESILSTLFSFERLPEGALEIIARNPDAIGMNCVAELAKLTRTGKADRVMEAIELLVEGTLTQKEAIKHASKMIQAPRARWTSQAIKIRSGRLDFCEYMMRGNTLRIDFRSEAHRVEAEEAIATALQAVADRLKASS